MINYFQQIIEMTSVASVVILAVIIVRLFIRKAPKIFSYLLWSVVLFRLLCPVSFATNLSLFNLKTLNTPAINIETQVEKTAQVNTITVSEPAEVEKTDKPTAPTLLSVSTIIWVAGMIIMLSVNLVYLLKLRRKVAANLHIRENIYIADEIDTPFCLGLIRPKIYLPSNLQEDEIEYIILHEQTHIRRMDHIVKILAFIALTVHWFNPLVWVSFVLACKDIEMSCDELVIRKMDYNIRKAYCVSILQLTTKKKLLLASPLSFANGSPKERIKNIMNYKKTALGAIIVTILVCLVVVIGLSTNAVAKTDTNSTPEVYDEEDTTENEYVSVERDSDKITVTYPEGYFEDDVDVVREIDVEKTEANLKNYSSLFDLFGTGFHMGSFLGVEDNGYFLMAIGVGVYYEGSWDFINDSEKIATFKDLNSGEEETLTIRVDEETGDLITPVFGEDIYWK